MYNPPKNSIGFNILIFNLLLIRNAKNIDINIMVRTFSICCITNVCITTYLLVVSTLLSLIVM